MKNLIFLSLFLLLLPLASADFISHKQNTPFNLIVSSNNATTCNLTYIQYPGGARQSYNRILTNEGRTFYTNLSAANYSALGTICHGVVCYDGSGYAEGSVCREVTPSGFKGTGTFFFLFIGIILLIFLVAFLLENNWIMMLGSILVLIFGFFVINNGIDIIKDVRVTWAVGLIIWALGIYFIFLSVEEALKQWK